MLKVKNRSANNNDFNICTKGVTMRQVYVYKRKSTCKKILCVLAAITIEIGFSLLFAVAIAGCLGWL